MTTNRIGNIYFGIVLASVLSLSARELHALIADVEAR
jgi:hypothetical protein